MNRHPAHMRVRLLLTIPLLAVAACSTKRDPLLEPIEPATTIPVTSTATATTPAPPSTAPTPVEVPSTQPPTEPPTTSLADVEQAIRQAVIASDAAYIRCLAAPQACDPDEFSTGPFAARTRSQAIDYAGSGLFAGDGPEPITYRIDTVEIVGSTAKVTGCRWDTSVLFGPPAPDGSPTVINDQRASSDVVVELELVGDRWKLREFEATSTRIDVNTCAG